MSPMNYKKPRRNQKLTYSLPGIISIEAVEGTQKAEWEDKTIYLYFDITYHHNVEGTVTEILTFIGHRIWFDT